MLCGEKHGGIGTLGRVGGGMSDMQVGLKVKFMSEALQKNVA